MVITDQAHKVVQPVPHVSITVEPLGCWQMEPVVPIIVLVRRLQHTFREQPIKIVVCVRITIIGMGVRVLHVKMVVPPPPILKPVRVVV